MRVTIWDLDWYYSKDKTNCQNPDVMLFSSYHKQLGDNINFVQSEADINRPYDLYYIIKEKESTPNPPIKFFTDKKVKWWGNACRVRVRWTPSREMLACRPDYLLYPEKKTRTERSNYIRLLDTEGRLLGKTQDIENAYTNKYTFCADEGLWYCKKEDLLTALKILQNFKNISFLKPIWLPKILNDKDIREQFLLLNFCPGSKIEWEPNIPKGLVEDAAQFWKEFKEKFNQVRLGDIIFNYAIPYQDPKKQWILFRELCDIIVLGKQSKIKLIPAMPTKQQRAKHLIAAPVMFEELYNFTSKSYSMSWIEYLTARYGFKWGEDAFFYMSDPTQWHEEFRDLVRQTWELKDFFITQWGDRKVSEINIPWTVFKKEFKYGL